MLDVERLEIAYGDAVAIRDVSLVVRERELVTVVGPNGAGKTTLINGLAGLLPTRSGTLRVEPSLGLAPAIADHVFEVVAAIHADGVAVLLVEQNVAQALAIAARAYVLEQGRIVAEGAAAELAQDARIREAYLGRQ